MKRFITLFLSFSTVIILNSQSIDFTIKNIDKNFYGGFNLKDIIFSDDGAVFCMVDKIAERFVYSKKVMLIGLVTMARVGHAGTHSSQILHFF